MRKQNEGDAVSCLVSKYIGSDFDHVMNVSENMDAVVTVDGIKQEVKELVPHIDNIKKVADGINEVKDVSDNMNVVADVHNNMDVVQVTSGNINTITQVRDKLPEVVLVADSMHEISDVHDNLDVIQLTSNNLNTINRVDQSIPEIQVVADNIDVIDTVAGQITNISDEQMFKMLRGAGYNVIGSTAKAVTITNSFQMVVHQTKLYKYIGALPHEVTLANFNRRDFKEISLDKGIVLPQVFGTDVIDLVNGLVITPAQNQYPKLAAFNCVYQLQASSAKLTVKSFAQTVDNQCLITLSDDSTVTAYQFDAASKKEIEPWFLTVNHLITTCNQEIGSIVRTLGLRNENDGGGCSYKIISANSNDYKITAYPAEFGDLALDNGTIAQRLEPLTTMRHVRYFAHRGGQRGIAENTLVACSEAINTGAFGVEIDCCITSDGVWYVYHDASLYLLTTGTDYFYNRTASYIDRIEFKKLAGTRYAKYAKIPRFEYFLDWAKNNGVNFTVEFKFPRVTSKDVDLDAGLQMIVDAGVDHQCHVQVTTDNAAQQVRRKSKKITLSYSLASLGNADSDLTQIYRDYENVIIQVPSESVNEKFKHGVKLAQAFGGDVIGFTSNNHADDVNKLVAAGVRNIISDRGWSK